MKKKGLGILMAMLVCVFAMGIPVFASTSYLDVKEGDRDSYYTYKDTGSAWENYYYVTPETYVGYPIIAHSMSQNSAIGSPFTEMYKNGSKYAYDGSAPGGVYYRLESGPSYMSGSGWHLTGRYTP